MSGISYLLDLVDLLRWGGGQINPGLTLMANIASGFCLLVFATVGPLPGLQTLEEGGNMQLGPAA